MLLPPLAMQWLTLAMRVRTHAVEASICTSGNAKIRQRQANATYATNAGASTPGSYH